jgi:hypothetical protein
LRGQRLRRCRLEQVIPRLPARFQTILMRESFMIFGRSWKTEQPA